MRPSGRRVLMPLRACETETGGGAATGEEIRAFWACKSVAAVEGRRRRRFKGTRLMEMRSAIGDTHGQEVEHRRRGVRLITEVEAGTVGAPEHLVVVLATKLGEIRHFGRSEGCGCGVPGI